LWVRYLDKGRYFIVPACKKAGEYGNYFLNIYFSTSIENHEPKYLTHYKGEEERCIKGSLIMEEEEEAVMDDKKYDYKDFIKVLASKAR